MNFRWVPNSQAIDCDVVLAATGQTVQTLKLPAVPRVGEELDLDLPHEYGEGSMYRVVRVRYHLRPRRVTTRDDLFGVLLFVEPAE
jgi:hypothetical protein